jgi:hypothetical protein
MSAIRIKVLFGIAAVAAAPLLTPAAHAQECLPVSTDPVLTCSMNGTCVTGKIANRILYHAGC